MGEESGQSPSWEAFGSYLRGQRQLAKLTLRQLAALAEVSNPYLSQIERGLHKPSLAVMKSIADALNLSVDALLQQAGVVVGPDPDGAPAASTETAISNDPRLSAAQKSALLAVYRSMVSGSPTPEADRGHGTPSKADAPRRPPRPEKSA